LQKLEKNGISAKYEFREEDANSLTVHKQITKKESEIENLKKAIKRISVERKGKKSGNKTIIEARERLENEVQTLFG